MCCDIVNRGLSYSMGQIYLQQADTNLLRLMRKLVRQTGLLIMVAIFLPL
jgi:hypothetical protein